jgi:hypothetical protein
MALPDRAAAAIIVTLAATPLLAPGGPGSEDSPWGLPDDLLAVLADRTRTYLEQAPGVACSETVRSVRYRQAKRFVDERHYVFEPGGSDDGIVVPEFHFEVKPTGVVRARPSRNRVGKFPSASDWARLFSAEYQPWFMYRDRGTRVEGYDWVRAIDFRGWFPLSEGRDIREWEGTALVEVMTMSLVEVRARPLNQEACLAKRFERWSRSLEIGIGLSVGPFFIPFTTLKPARRPLGHEVVVRFDHRHGDLRLPALLEYEARQAVSRHETAPWGLSTRRFSDCRPAAARPDDPIH